MGRGRTAGRLAQLEERVRELEAQVEGLLSSAAASVGELAPAEPEQQTTAGADALAALETREARQRSLAGDDARETRS